MAYQRVTSTDPFSSGVTAATTVINAIETGLEAAETTIASHTTSIATNATAIAAETTARTEGGTFTGTISAPAGSSLGTSPTVPTLGVVLGNANASSGSPTLTWLTGTTYLAVGQSISGTGIPSGTTITAISGSTVTISQNTTTQLTVATVLTVIREESSGTYANQTLSNIVNGGYYFVSIPVSSYSATGTLTVDGQDIGLFGSAGLLNVTGGFVGTSNASPSLVMSGTTNATGLSIKKITPSAAALTFGYNVDFRSPASSSDGMKLGIGSQSLQYTPSSRSIFDNLAIGNQSLCKFISGSRNTVVGHNSAISLISGTYNTVVGAGNATVMTYASNNTIMGAYTGIAVTTGSGNTLIGRITALNLSTGSNNVFIGNGSGNTVTTGSNNTAIGGGGPNAATLAGTIAIGRDSSGTTASATANDMAVIGTTLTTLKCGAVSGSSGAWALGIRVAQASSVLDTTQYISVKVDGTTYKLALVV